MKYSTNIVECLRSIGIEPKCTSKSVFDNNQIYSPENVINYISNNDHYFQSNDTIPSQWWMIDFRKKIRLVSYKIVSGPSCYWIREWRIYTSLNGDSFNLVDSYGQAFSKNETISLSANGCDKYTSLLAFYRVFFYGLIHEIQTCNKSINNFKKSVLLLVLILLSYHPIKKCIC